MTSAKPFTLRELAARETFGFGPTPAKPSRCPQCELENARGVCVHFRDDPPQQLAEQNAFDSAIDILAYRGRITNRKDCHNKIDFIYRLYKLEKFGETAPGQETSGSKSMAFQKEGRWGKRRCPICAKGAPRLPPALEQEVEGQRAPRREALIKLRDKYRRPKAGAVASHALIHFVCRLQSMACQYAPRLAWSGRNIPGDLIRFIVEVLEATGIRYPDIYGENPSKFRSLMIKPALNFDFTMRALDRGEPAAEPPPDSELECRLARLPL
jgi:hypothetical protein